MVKNLIKKLNLNKYVRIFLYIINNVFYKII